MTTISSSSSTALVSGGANSGHVATSSNYPPVREMASFQTSGHVTQVGTDAIPEPDAQVLEGQPANELQSLILVGNVQGVQNWYFR